MNTRTITRVNNIDYIDYNDGLGRKERYLATSGDQIHWYAQIYVGHPYGYVDISLSPAFKNPVSAILWAKNWKENV